MKINEKTLYAFANSRSNDKEGFLLKRGEVNKAFQKRWFVLKGNLLFYYEKKGNAEPLGMIILEGCLIELAEYEEERFCFSISFPGNRTYVLAAENQVCMEDWMKALTTAGYDYMRLMISELQRQLAELDNASSSSSKSSNTEIPPPVPSRSSRCNPFDKKNGTDNKQNTNGEVTLRQAPSPPAISTQTIRDDECDFLTIHEYFGKSWNEVFKRKMEEKEKTDKPLIVF